MDTSFLPFLLLAATLGLLLGIALLRIKGDPKKPLKDFLLWIGYGLLLGLFQALVFRSLFQSRFAVFRAWTHDLSCVLLPLLAWRSLLWVRASVLGRVLGTLGLLLFLGAEATYIYAKEVAPFDLEVVHHQVPCPGLDHRVRVLALADLQCEAIGPYEKRVFAKIRSLRPDLILLLGDYLQVQGETFARERLNLLKELANLAPPLGIYALEGDADEAGLSLKGSGIPILRDQARILPKEPQLALLGLRRWTSRKPLTESDLAPLRDFKGQILVLGHAPDFMNSLIRAQLQKTCQAPLLCLAGHTHGGQIQIPGFGPLITLSSVPRDIAAGGLFQRGTATLIVSRGVGVERGYAPRVRLFCRPELTVVDLLPKKKG